MIEQKEHETSGSEMKWTSKNYSICGQALVSEGSGRRIFVFHSFAKQGSGRPVKRCGFHHGRQVTSMGCTGIALQPGYEAPRLESTKDIKGQRYTNWSKISGVCQSPFQWRNPLENHFHSVSLQNLAVRPLKHPLYNPPGSSQQFSNKS